MPATRSCTRNNTIKGNNFCLVEHFRCNIIQIVIFLFLRKSYTYLTNQLYKTNLNQVFHVCEVSVGHAYNPQRVSISMFRYILIKCKFKQFNKIVIGLLWCSPFKWMLCSSSHMQPFRKLFCRHTDASFLYRTMDIAVLQFWWHVFCLCQLSSFVASIFNQLLPFLSVQLQ